jgi:hypothetical protein
MLKFHYLFQKPILWTKIYSAIHSNHRNNNNSIIIIVSLSMDSTTTTQLRIIKLNKNWMMRLSTKEDGDLSSITPSERIYYYYEVLSL